MKPTLFFYTVEYWDGLPRCAVGPFETRQEAYEAMCSDARNELPFLRDYMCKSRLQLFEDGFDASIIMVNPDGGHPDCGWYAKWTLYGGFFGNYKERQNEDKLYDVTKDGWIEKEA